MAYEQAEAAGLDAGRIRFDAKRLTDEGLSDIEALAKQARGRGARRVRRAGGRVSDEAFDWERYYDEEMAENTCNLCTQWLKRFPGSDERILAERETRRFNNLLTCYRPNPADQERLREEWVRRRVNERRERDWR